MFTAYVRFSLILLLATLIFGVLGSFSFLYPETLNRVLPFYQVHAMHVSAAVFWIISGASVCVLHYGGVQTESTAAHLFMGTWMATVAAIFVSYFFRQFGGREYWEFPPVLCVPLLAGWLLLMVAYFGRKKQAPVNGSLYRTMWATGLLFFLFTFIEQNLWQVPWFRNSLLKDITVQWKANGSMVGAWNQMIYGTSLFVMVRLANDITLGTGRQAKFFYLLSITNLMFNWGHHIYNLPVNSWIRDVSYVISMTEWIILINIIRGFRGKMEERQRMKHLVTYKFIIAAEFWLYANLVLALFMSIPAFNRFSHGTHITVAHAMGSTIGINTMILLAGFSYMVRLDISSALQKKLVVAGYYIAQVSLVIFWISLVTAGVIKGYRSVVLNISDFNEMMAPVLQMLRLFMIAGIGVLAGFIPIVSVLFSSVRRLRVVQTL